MHAMTAVVVSAGLLLTATAARADDASQDATTRVHVALGINSPLGWATGTSFGGSLYAGVGNHHALRLNVARYDYASSAVGNVLSVAAGGEGDEASYHGRTTDVGIGWVYYPRRMWSGWMLELGLVRRARDHHIDEDAATPAVVDTRTTAYAGRAMVGWSWLMFDHVFLALAVGVSLGHESGTETTQQYEGAMPVRADVSRSDVHGEGLLRLGAAFDL